jgi:molybdenum cofactor cytidylyltransferase
MTRPTVLILASGRGERFVASGGQGSKLQALLLGKPVLQWTLDAVRATGLPYRLEDAGPEVNAGMGDSIAAAVRATQGANGWLILPGDLPAIQPQTILAVADALAQGAQAAYPMHAEERGHPVGFSNSACTALLNLKGNQGAARILAGLIATKIIVNDPSCVMDVDTLDQLRALETHLQT